LLPFVDGVFATMLASGYIETFSSIVNVAFTVFAGAGALAVLYSESGSVQEARNMVLHVTPILILGGIFTGLAAPVFTEIFYVGRLKYATGLAILSISLQLGGIEKAEVLSVPAIIVTGLVMSLRNPSAIELSTAYILPALLTVSTAALGLLLASGLRNRIKVDYIRKSGAVVLLTISASLFGLNIPSMLGPGVLAASIMISIVKD
ncbi:MAG: DUF5794 domain-containing protein, partial [Candidatus Nanohalobium sp.]